MYLRLFKYVVIATFLALSVAAASVGVEEYQVKAVFTYNFAKFVDWPAGSFKGNASPFVITVLGSGKQAETFETISGQTVKNRKVEIRNVTRVEDIGDSHILFVCATEQKHIKEIINLVTSRGILTISDIEKFVQTGGIIRLVMVGDKIRFEINLHAANRSGLRISSRLLKLARTIIDE